MSRRLAYLAGGLLATAIAAAGCANDSVQPTIPPPSQVPPPSPPGPSFTISGVVFEHTATERRPAPGILLSVLAEEAVITTSDSNGRFSAHVRGDVVAIAPAQTAAYVSPCPAGTTFLSRNPDRTFELNIVSKDVLSTTGVPDSYPITSIYVSGTILEQTPQGPRPVAGALVSLGDDSTLSFSTTLSDSLGHYVVCTAPPGVGTDQLMTVRATKDGYSVASLWALGGWDERDINMELVRIP